MTPQRLTPGRLLELQRDLSPRALLVLALLRRLRVATAGQIETLVFTDGRTDSNARLTRRLLARLVELRVLARLDYRPGGVRGGAQAAVYALDVAGLRLTDPADRPYRSVRHPWTTTPAFLAHHLQGTQLYCDLIAGQRQGLGEVLDFVTEPAAWRTYTSPASAKTLRPDAYCILGIAEEYQDYWFIEVDLATEGPAQLARKCHAYAAYWRTGLEAARSGVHPRTVFVVPDERRRAQMVAVFRRQAAETWPLFAVALRREAASRLLAGALGFAGPG